MQLASLETNKCPKFLWKNPSSKDHLIYLREKDIWTPLQL